MKKIDWLNEIENEVTISDPEGIIIYMNKKSIQNFSKYGGENLIGSSLYDCHPEASKSKLKELFINQKPNTYFILKNGIKKLIHQVPWFKKGKYAGIVEISIPIPVDIPTFQRN